MFEKHQRYAIYFAPEKGSALANFAYEWLGLDAETGVIEEAPTPYVDSPRRYGFHATLKAPMRLANGRKYSDFRNAVANLTGTLKPISLGQLKLKQIGNFLALCVDENYHSAVSDLAWQCVTELDEFRATLNEAERNKRKNLSPDQEENLETWGYPYVGNAFRFHMTLTSSLENQDLEKAKSLLTGKIPTEDVTLNTICIFGDPDGIRPFELVERFYLQD